MLCDIRKFNSQSVEDHVADKLAGLSLGEYFRLRKFTPRLLNDYLAPTGAAIWSAPACPGKAAILRSLSGPRLCLVKRRFEE